MRMMLILLNDVYNGPLKVSNGDCEDTLLPLSYLDYQSDEKRLSLWDKDRLGNEPHWIPSFLSRCSWMFQERLRSKCEPVGSDEVLQV